MNKVRSLMGLVLASSLVTSGAPESVRADDFIPEPDIIYFGAAPVGEVVQVERGTNQLVDTEVLASNAAGPSGYAVRVKLVQPVTTPTPATPPTGKAYLGNRATVFVNGVAQGQVILDERGQIYQLDFPNPARTASPNAVLTPVRLVPSVPQPPSCGAVTCTATSTRTATPTPTITQTPTITATPTPTSTGAIVDGAVTLQGRPPTPDPRWQVPLRVSLTRQGEPTPFLQLTPSTDATGHFRLDGLDPGTYEIRVKNPKTLQVKQTVTLASGVTGVNFGILRAGDANDDNVVSLIDFSILRTTFGLTVGQPGYDGRADFNDNQTVNVLDFSLMRPNFSQVGAALQYRAPAAAAVAEASAPVATPTAAAVQLRVVAPTTDIEVGATLTVTVEVRSGRQPVDGAAAYLDYDAGVLEAVSLEPGTALPQVLQNDLTTAGQVNYAAGTFEDFPSGTFTLLTVTFRAIAEPVGTQIAVAEALGRQTDVTFGGESILTCRVGATVGFGSAEPVVGTPGSSEGTPAVVLATATAAAPEPESPTPTPTVTPAGGGNVAVVEDDTAASSGCAVQSGDARGGGLVLLGLLALLWGRQRR